MADETPDAPQRDPGIGSDEWVARSGANVERGRFGGLVARVELLPPLVRYGLLVLPIAAYPAVANTDYLLQVGLDTLIYVLLALGLNVAVGWAGILDLGYIAFFGFGAYGYALLASGQFDTHLQAQWAIPIVVVGTVAPRLPARAAVATALRRLPRDRHALLLPGLPDAAEQPRPAQPPGPRAAGHHWRPERDLRHRPVQLLRLDADDGHAVLLRRRRRARRRDDGALSRQPLAHGPRVARPARGRPRRRGDEHAGRLAQAARVRIRRRGRGPHGDDPRRGAGSGLPASTSTSRSSSRSTRW